MEEFCKNKATKDGLNFYCRRCNSKRCKEGWAKNREARRETKLAHNYVSRYGVDIRDVEELRRERAGVCACCGEVVAKLFVDHDHQSGLVRDLICHSCNLTLGHSKESPERLRSAAEYIERHVSAVAA